MLNPSPEGKTLLRSISGGEPDRSPWDLYLSFVFQIQLVHNLGYASSGALDGRVLLCNVLQQDNLKFISKRFSMHSHNQ
jgi:hypothetical protein